MQVVLADCESVVRDEAGKGLTAGNAHCASLTDDSSSILELMPVGKNRLPRAVSPGFHTCAHSYTHTFFFFFFKERDERKETLLLVLNIS